MYYYWVNRGIRPSVFYDMPRGELTVVQAFYEMELAEREKIQREIENQRK